MSLGERRLELGAGAALASTTFWHAAPTAFAIFRSSSASASPSSSTRRDLAFRAHRPLGRHYLQLFIASSTWRSSQAGEQDSSDASAEVEGTSRCVADESGRSGLALYEIDPFFSLGTVNIDQFESAGELAVGCQWSSRNAPGFRVTTAAAIVVEIGKLRESKI